MVYCNRGVSADIVSVIKEIRSVFPEVNLPAKELEWWIIHYSRIKKLFEICLLKKLSSFRVLEVGVGYGVIAAFLSNYPETKVICTEHPTRNYLWKKEFRRFFLKKGVTIVAHNVNEGLPFRDSAFDAVFFCDVVEHLPVERIPQIIDEICRVLKAGAFMILTTPNLLRLENRLKVLTGKSPNPSFPVEIIGGTFGHIREFTLKEMLSLLTPHFKLVEVEMGLLPVFDKMHGGKKKLCSFIKKLFPNLRDEIYILLQKK